MVPEKYTSQPAARQCSPAGQRVIPVGGDLQLIVSTVTPDHGPAMLDLRLARRAPLSAEAGGDIAGEFLPTNAGLRCPLHLAALLTEAIERVSRQAMQGAQGRASDDGGEGA